MPITAQDQNNSNLAEAIRIASLPSPILENNDKSSIKKFYFKFEEYKILGGTRPVATLLRKQVSDNLTTRYDLTEAEFLALPDSDIFSYLFKQFHARNSFSWADEFKTVKLKRSKDYSFGPLRKYIEDFKFAIKCAGPDFQPSDNAMSKIFIRGIEDQSLASNIRQHDPKTLLEAFKLAEEARVVLCDFVSTGNAIGLQMKAPESSKNTPQASAPQDKSSDQPRERPSDAKKWCSHHKTTSHNDEDCLFLKR
jgi:hypothetical protein